MTIASKFARRLNPQNPSSATGPAQLSLVARARSTAGICAAHWTLTGAGQLADLSASLRDVIRSLD